MQAAIAGIAIENVLVGHIGLLTGPALQQTEDLFIQLSAFLLRPPFRVVFVFHILITSFMQNRRENAEKRHPPLNV